MVHFTSPMQSNIENQEEYVAAFEYYARIILARYADRIPIWFTFNEPNLGSEGITAHSYNAYTSILLAHGKSTADIDAANRYQDFMVGIMGNPLFRGKQYPDSVLNTPGLNLTALTKAQIAEIKGTCDFWAYDPYTVQFATPASGGIEACARNTEHPQYPKCVDLGPTQANGWITGRSSESYPLLAPQHVRQQVGYVWKPFRPTGIMITEFGFPEFH
ncbi:hypothetical protein SAPIO_CDS6342 [Scedosporium apiospermum]|uniref:Glycoside hydrolase family 1 protein n=1 Tax=Pseudallescheria apiosperma TaxID=563466 RepID=A0A084G442_PSEDA|nr:uncharacterized protein SAPIO_CDS6342 [Scedosporium apiospermum]KEZ42104.1 hypothetical protein SAPIO_CDS6342 [Scedosporium apiospermum]